MGNTVRILMLVSILMISAHCIGCIFFFIALQSHLYGDPGNWVTKNNLADSCLFGQFSANQTLAQVSQCAGPPSVTTMRTQYVTAVYWAIYTLTTTGYEALTHPMLAQY